jgi:hypothetical protein
MHRYRGESTRQRRPFWLPASNFYILAASVSIAFFFLVWGLLNDGRVDETPWVPAGIGAALILGGAVVIREVVLREARNRYLDSRRMIDRSVRGIARRVGDPDRIKLTLERNAAILHDISKKSEAAKVLGRFAEGHREVFELCDEYLAAVSRELPHVGAGSPRIAALRRGAEVAGRYHHYHMLRWAELETNALTRQAGRHDRISDKLDSAQAALEVVEFALRSYPGEAALVDSQRLLGDLVASVKISDLVKKAQNAVSRGNDKRALGLYEDALFLIRARDPDMDTDASISVVTEIERLRIITNEVDSDRNRRPGTRSNKNDFPTMS